MSVVRRISFFILRSPSLPRSSLGARVSAKLYFVGEEIAWGKDKENTLHRQGLLPPSALVGEALPQHVYAIRRRYHARRPDRAYLVTSTTLKSR